MGRSLHSLVNLKFQSDGAILVKTATCFLFGTWVPKYKIDANLAIQQHDELQAWAKAKDVPRYSELFLKALKMSGEYYSYNVPITGEVKVGMNWAETH